MISVMTPNIHNALDMMNTNELVAMENAIVGNNEDLVVQMLAAKNPIAALDACIQQITNDPMIQMLQSEEVCWGDLMMLLPASAMFHEPKEDVIDPDAEWIMPVLSLRKDIWENFPVVVCLLETKGCEEYAIRWHKKNYQEQREACEHGWQYMDFEDDTYRRLMKALNASRFWTVQPAKYVEDLCTIVMHDSEEKPLKPFVLPSSQVNDTDSVTSEIEWIQVSKKPAVPAVPTLRRLNDMKDHFPVIWNEVPAKTKTYAVELFGKKIKEQGLNANKVKADLLAALKASKSWTVLPGNEKCVCLLQMNHL